MYIDTSSEAEIRNSICSYFGISAKELLSLIDNLECQMKFIKDENPNNPIDEILFFHLTRRLDSVNEHLANNLYDLLSTENSMTDFLKQHEIEFSPCEGYLDLIYKGKLAPLNYYTDSADEALLRQRLGQNKERPDFCVDGFIFGDLSSGNLRNYINRLGPCPEIISVLANVLDQRDIVRNYMQKSTYYCFKYGVPINKVFFEEDHGFSNDEKRQNLLKKSLESLRNGYTPRIEDSMLTLAENDTMQEDYFISKKILDKNKL